ncbi:MAG: molybdate ABC transporter substrate-binding protein, partial [Pseudomonadota bacterium]
MTRFCAFALFVLALAPGPACADAARIAVAANFRTVLAALQPVFEEETAHDITVVSGSTGKLYAQIVNGAPFDVFLAADQARPLRLEADGRAAGRFTYAVGRLVLWDPAGVAVGPDRLRSGEDRRLA